MKKKEKIEFVIRNFEDIRCKLQAMSADMHMGNMNLIQADTEIGTILELIDARITALKNLLEEKGYFCKCFKTEYESMDGKTWKCIKCGKEKK